MNAMVITSVNTSVKTPKDLIPVCVLVGINLSMMEGPVKVSIYSYIVDIYI